MSSSALEMAEWSRARAGQEGEPQREWVALVSVAVFLDLEDERAQRINDLGTHALFLDLDDPPKPSHLVLHPRVARRAHAPRSAYILAADDRSACILLQVVQGTRPDLVLCDTNRRTVTLLPPVPPDLRENEGLDIGGHLSIGLIADPRRRGHYLVAQLHPTTSRNHPTKLLCYSTAEGRWFARQLTIPQQDPRCHPFSENVVLAHDGRLWWIALACGVFFCDPFDELPQLRFVPFPYYSKMDGNVRFKPRICTLLHQRRCVRPSEGKLRFVEIRGFSYADGAPQGRRANPVVWMWTLDDDDPEGPNPWKLEYGSRFNETWENEVPHVAFVDPNDHYVVYFLQDGSKLFGVNMRESKVVVSEECLDRDQLVFQSSRPVVDAWVLPPPSPPTLPGHDDSSPDASVHSWLNRSEWQRGTDASDESWRTSQITPPPPDEASVSQADDEAAIQLPASLYP